MTLRRLLVLAVLVYVTLDLSVAAMPGAFVFEPEYSTEGTHIRARHGTETVALPVQARGAATALLQVPQDRKERLAPVGPAEQRGRRPAVGWRARASVYSAPSSEDPH